MTDFQEEVKRYKEKTKTERENLEKVLIKADKVTTYLYNSALMLSKSLGKVLHNLLMNVDYDVKDIVSKIMTEDISKIYEWTHWFEKNEYLKRHKLFRNMNEKLGFYKKMEVPLLQDAYNRISNFLRQTDRLADRGEFSILNASQANFFNKSRVSVNRSVFSNKNHSMQDDVQLNILDELNNEGNGGNLRNENLSELLSRLEAKLTNEPLLTMPPVLVNDSLKKFQTLTEKFTASVLLISADPKQNSTSTAAESMKIPDSFLLKNQEFYLDCLEELQNKLKFGEVRMSMIHIILKDRGVLDTDFDAIKLTELLSRNRTLNEDDFVLNYDEKNGIELLRLLEEAFEEKHKTFKAKKLFMDHVRQIKEDYQVRLAKIYDQLNSIEDEYILSEKTIETLLDGILQNNNELKSLNEKVRAIHKERDIVEKRLKLSESEVTTLKNQLAKLSEEVTGERERNDEQTKRAKAKIKEHESLQTMLLSEQLGYFENKEKCDYIDELSARITPEVESLRKLRGRIIRGKSS